MLGVDDPARGEEVCAVVVPAADGIDAAALAARTRAKLSSYKVPTRWVVARSDRLPTLPSGKVDRKALRRMIVDGELTSVDGR